MHISCQRQTGLLHGLRFVNKTARESKALHIASARTCMLRKKLIVILCSVLALLVTTAIGAIVSLQGILSELYHLETRSWAVTEEANKLSEAVSATELELLSQPDGEEGARRLQAA